MKVIVATGNPGKAQELKKILAAGDMEVTTMKEEGFFSEPPETGKTFEENALIKARALMELIKQDTDFCRKNPAFCVVADDSGLCVDYLDGAPGIMSARYAGAEASDRDRYMKLLAELEGVPAEKRKARFVCAAAVIFHDGREFVSRGEWEGMIAQEPEGSGGFDYDPIFYIPDLGMTVAAMPAEEKNRISHRAKAFGKLAAIIRENACR